MIEEYPRNLIVLEADFSTETACRDYLARLRRPDGFRCPRCGGAKAWPVRNVLFQCADCDWQTSVTAGTIFQDTRTLLPVWFRAMWWVTTQKYGASALGLQRVLGLKSYETAWAWLHKFRRAMVRPGRDLLTGRVEVDESYVGGPEEGLPGRLNLEKALVVVAAEEDGAGIGRIRLRQIVDASAESLIPFVRESVVAGSTVHTDGWLGYTLSWHGAGRYMLTMSEAVSFIPSSLAFSSGSSLDGCFRAVYSFALMPESPAIDLVAASVPVRFKFGAKNSNVMYGCCKHATHTSHIEQMPISSRLISKHTRVGYHEPRPAVFGVPPSGRQR